MAELMVEWADLVDMPLGSLLGPGAAGGSGGSLSRAYSTGGGSSSRNLLQGSTSTAAGGADGSGNGAAGQDGAQLDVLLLQVRATASCTATRHCTCTYGALSATMQELALRRLRLSLSVMLETAVLWQQQAGRAPTFNMNVCLQRK